MGSALRCAIDLLAGRTRSYGTVACKFENQLRGVAPHPYRTCSYRCNGWAPSYDRVGFLSDRSMEAGAVDRSDCFLGWPPILRPRHQAPVHDTSTIQGSGGAP